MERLFGPLDPTTKDLETFLVYNYSKGIERRSQALYENIKAHLPSNVPQAITCVAALKNYLHEIPNAPNDVQAALAICILKEMSTMSKAELRAEMAQFDTLYHEFIPFYVFKRKALQQACAHYFTTEEVSTWRHKRDIDALKLQVLLFLHHHEEPSLVCAMKEMDIDLLTDVLRNKQTSLLEQWDTEVKTLGNFHEVSEKEALRIIERLCRLLQLMEMYKRTYDKRLLKTRREKRRRACFYTTTMFKRAADAKKKNKKETLKGFQNFVTIQRPIIMNQFPDIDSVNMCIQLKRKWRRLAKADKERFSQTT